MTGLKRSWLFLEGVRKNYLTERGVGVGWRCIKMEWFIWYKASCRCHNPAVSILDFAEVIVKIS